jgi:AcrR family transcriptional regulator
MAKSTRARMIVVASDLFYRDGFHAVGIDNILTIVGVTKTTFYNHFESKEQLILEVLRDRDRWWRESFPQMLQAHGGESPRDQLYAVFDVFDEMLRCEDFNGCIFVNVAVEFPLPRDPIHIAAAEHKRVMELILRDLALRAGATDPIALAEELSMLFEGAFVTRQVTCNPRTVEIARRLGEAIFAKYLPDSKVQTSSLPLAIH